MINIEVAKKEFIEYINKIKTNSPRDERKVAHTFRVMENCRKIATQLKLTEEQIKLAQLIGLLHDIGRFEQYRIYNKIIDSGTLDNNIKFDHGKEGVKILKKDNYIRKYIEDSKYDDIIFTAIYEHNKYQLSDNLREQEKLFCNIIKDADKIDIIYEGIYIYWQEEEKIKNIEEGKLSKKMLEDFYKCKLANNENRISEADQILRFSSFIYDINFKYSFEILKETDNISKMIDRFKYKIPKTKSEMMKVKEIVKKYIIEKTK